LYGGISNQILTNAKYVMMENDQIDLVGCKPCEYRETNLHCTRPLYLVNQISILSTFDTKHDYNLGNLLNVYHLSCLVTMAVCVLLFISITSLKSTLWKSFWAYVDPLIGRRDNMTFKCFSYTIYLLALIPFLEIIRNELLASLITVKEVKLDTLDDLLDPKVTVYMFINHNYWSHESEMIDDVQLKEKLKSLFTKVSKQTNVEDWLKLLQNPDELRGTERKSACIYDDYRMRWIKVINFLVVKKNN
jgi:hypothetical protein